MKPLTDKEIEKLPYPVFDILKPHAKIYDMSKRYNARVEIIVPHYLFAG